jgi:hypothetical protein
MRRARAVEILFWGLRNADWQMIRTEKEKGWPEFNQGQPLDG